MKLSEDEAKRFLERLCPLQETEQQLLCPRCGAPMVRRRATRGPNAGKEFYGCTNYPRCRGIVNIDQ